MDGNAGARRPTNHSVGRRGRWGEAEPKDRRGSIRASGGRRGCGVAGVEIKARNTVCTQVKVGKKQADLASRTPSDSSLAPSRRAPREQPILSPSWPSFPAFPNTLLPSLPSSILLHSFPPDARRPGCHDSPERKAHRAWDLPRSASCARWFFVRRRRCSWPRSWRLAPRRRAAQAPVPRCRGARRCRPSALATSSVRRTRSGCTACATPRARRPHRFGWRTFGGCRRRSSPTSTPAASPAGGSPACTRTWRIESTRRIRASILS